tara:strand:- start:471 stop:1469 length:999 start_codon:yes stop_codon:yes gene_type:complete
MDATTPKLSKNVMDSFRTMLNGRINVSFDEFVGWALYDSKIGYYKRKQKRVGKGKEDDFYTSTTLGKTWGELIIASSIELLKDGLPSHYCFVEIGAEPDRSVFDGLTHPFSDHKIIRHGDPFDIPEKAVVYSNEWLDARPFKRFKYSRTQGCWLEIFVGLENCNLKEFEKISLDMEDYPFPAEAPDGYCIDWPSGSISSLNDLIQNKSWAGIFMTFDYGLDLKTICKDRPEGTARAYSKHKMDSELLSDPGSKDLTCHICWDSVKKSLECNGFKQVELTSQESFFIKHASNYMQKIFEKSHDQLNPDMLALKEIIHPAHLGHGLQALSGIRV